MLFNLHHFARLCCALLVLVLGVQASAYAPHAATSPGAVVDLISAGDAGAGETSEAPAGQDHDAAGDQALLSADAFVAMTPRRVGPVVVRNALRDPQGGPLETLRRPPKLA